VPARVPLWRRRSHGPRARGATRARHLAALIRAFSGYIYLGWNHFVLSSQMPIGMCEVVGFCIGVFMVTANTALYTYLSWCDDTRQGKYKQVIHWVNI
jgi:hypothetical protein